MTLPRLRLLSSANYSIVESCTWVNEFNFKLRNFFLTENIAKLSRYRMQVFRAWEGLHRRLAEASGIKAVNKMYM